MCISGMYLDSWTLWKFPAESMKVVALHFRTDSKAGVNIATAAYILRLARW